MMDLYDDINHDDGMQEMDLRSDSDTSFEPKQKKRRFSYKRSRILVPILSLAGIVVVTLCVVFAVQKNKTSPAPTSPRPTRKTQPTQKPEPRAAIEPGTENSILVVFNVTGDCQTSLSRVELSRATPPFPWRAMPLHWPTRVDELEESLRHPGEMESTFALVIHQKDRWVGQVAADPRHVHLFDADDVTPKIPSHAELLFYLPKGTQKATLYCQALDEATGLAVDVVPRRKASPSSEITVVGNGVEYKAVNELGPPSEQLNLIFVSAGYQSSEKQKFFNHVDKLIELMTDASLIPGFNLKIPERWQTMRRSSPHSRYLDFWNLYAVFQPSTDSGATRKSQNSIKDNNLDCEYPQEREASLTCDWRLAKALAKVTPADPDSNPGKSVIVALVNDGVYGGTAIQAAAQNLRYCTFFTGPLNDGATEEDETIMLSLVFHEIGHALGGLNDEYVRFKGGARSGYALTNCEASSSGGTPPSPSSWQHWIDAYTASPSTFLTTYGNGISDRNWKVLDVPSQGCYFGSAYKSNSHCLMHRVSDPFLCPVCREHATIEILKLGFGFGWPRYPLQDHVLLLLKTPATGADKPLSVEDTVYLQLPTILSDSSFQISAQTEGGQSLSFDTSGSCPVCVVLTPTFLKSLTTDIVHKIIVKVTDTLPFVHPSRRDQIPATQSAQSIVFRIKIVSSEPTTSSSVTLEDAPSVLRQIGTTSGRASTAKRYVECAREDGGSNPLCSLSLASKNYEYPENLNQTVASFDVWVFGIVGGMAFLMIILWIIAAGAFSNMSNGVVRPIFKTHFSFPIQILRVLMMITAVGFMIGSFVALAVSTYFYTQLTAIGKLAVIIGGLLSIILYALAFVGFWGVYSRSKRMLMINFICLFLTLILTSTLYGLTAKVVKDIDNKNSSVYSKLQALWKQYVQDDPSRICAIQGALHCSGFFDNCASFPIGNPFCPTACEETNVAYVKSCHDKVVAFVKTHSETLKILLACSIIFLVVSLLFCGICFVALHRRKAYIKKLNAKRVQRIRQASKIDAATNARHRYDALLLLLSLNSTDKSKLKKEFARIDIDKSGTLDKVEMCFFLKKSLCHKPSREEVDEIFAILDRNRDGHVDMNEFMSLFSDRNATDPWSVRVREELERRGLTRAAILASQRALEQSQPAASSGYRPMKNDSPTPARPHGVGVAARRPHHPASSGAHHPPAQELAVVSPSKPARSPLKRPLDQAPLLANESSSNVSSPTHLKSATSLNASVAETRLPHLTTLAAPSTTSSRKPTPQNSSLSAKPAGGHSRKPSTPHSRPKAPVLPPTNDFVWE